MPSREHLGKETESDVWESEQKGHRELCRAVLCLLVPDLRCKVAYKRRISTLNGTATEPAGKREWDSLILMKLTMQPMDHHTGASCGRLAL